jgi:hypothetical protein
MMKYARIPMAMFVGLALLAVAGCSSGNHSSDTEAEVFLSQDITQGPADQNVNSQVDVTIGSMTINSHFKNPSSSPAGSQADVTLTDWVITPSRSDGGTVASPVWRNYYSVYVPQGGSATLQNYRIFPSEYYRQPPLNQLFPENGGIDKETGKTNIRQRLQVAVYGKTVAGKSVSLSFPVDVNFFYQ